MTDINNNFDFTKLINEVNEMIPDLKKDLLENIPGDRKADLKSYLYTNLIERTLALYSSGIEKKQITESLLETVTAFEDGFKWEGFEKSYAMYDQIIWILSLGILCNIDDADFERIVKVIRRDNATDKLIAKLVNYKIPDSIQDYSTDYIQKSPYAELDTIVSGTNPAASAIKEYLDKKWYKGHTDAPWYDAHKNKKVNIFFGYWAWETAALAKIYNIDDNMLRGQQYYPYQAVHWKNP